MAERIEEFIVPIISAHPAQKSPSLRLLGTAFFVGHSSTFVTAWHVFEREIQSARQRGEEIFLVINGKQRRFLPIVQWHRPDKCADIAVGLVGYTIQSPLTLSADRVSFGKSVCTLGYSAHLFKNSRDSTAYKAPLRFMRGYIHSDIWQSEIWPYENLMHAREPVDFVELNFPIPPGVSGSPLLLEGSHTVVGVCVGTDKGEIFDTIVEREEDKETKIFDVERIGIAHMSSMIADCTAPWLNGMLIKDLKA